jgi:hypothetical protein
MSPPKNQRRRAVPFGLLVFWNYRIGTFDNLTLRTKFYDENRFNGFDMPMVGRARCAAV